jgi:hypothetical protein
MAWQILPSVGTQNRVRWLHLLGKECVKAVNAFCVAATLKLCGKKNIERFFGYLSTNKAFT